MSRSAVQKREGSILILAVWAMLFLSVLSVAVSSNVSGNLMLATRMKGRNNAYYAARAGVESAIAVISSYTNIWDGTGDTGLYDEMMFTNVVVGDGEFSVIYVAEAEEGVFATNIGIIGESRKINLYGATNVIGRGLVRSLLESACDLDRDEADEIADCIADWIDSDDEVREHGAESDTYSGLSHGYECHNGPIEDVRELLMVQGVTYDIFDKLRPHITVFGTNISVDINTAGYTVLRSLAGTRDSVEPSIARGLAERIIAFREEGDVFMDLRKGTLKDLLFGKTAMSREDRKQWLALEWLVNYDMVTVQSRYFCGIAVGKLPRESVAERRISFVYDREEGAIRAWHEE